MVISGCRLSFVSWLPLYEITIECFCGPQAKIVLCFSSQPLLYIIFHLHVTLTYYPFSVVYSLSVDVLRALQTKAVRIISNSRTPITEHALDADLLYKNIQYFIVLSIRVHDVRNSREVVLSSRLHGSQRTRSLKSPGDHVKTSSLGSIGEWCRNNAVVVGTTDHDQVRNGRTDDVDAHSLVSGEVCGESGDVSGSVSFDEVDGLLAELVVVLEPEDDVVEEERLRPDTVEGDVPGVIVSTTSIFS